MTVAELPLAELPFIGDQIVCLSHDQSARPDSVAAGLVQDRRDLLHCQIAGERGRDLFDIVGIGRIRRGGSELLDQYGGKAERRNPTK